MQTKESGQITVETAIVLPIVMMIAAFLVVISLYIHDVITIKSFAYSSGVQSIEKDFDSFKRSVQEKIKKAPVFVLKPNALCSNKGTYFEIAISADEKRHINRMGTFVNPPEYHQIIKIEKKMPKEVLYGFRAISDNLKNRK